MSPLTSRLLLVSCIAGLATAPRIVRDSTPRSPSAPSRLAFASHRDGNWNVYVMLADGGPATRLTMRPEQERFPLWSPDDRPIAYGVQTDHGWELWAMAANGTGARHLFGPIAAKTHRQWSPDGARIVFGSAMPARPSRSRSATRDSTHGRVTGGGSPSSRVATALTRCT